MAKSATFDGQPVDHEFEALTLPMLTQEALAIAQSLVVPQFDAEGNLIAGNCTPYFIGSSPRSIVDTQSDRTVLTWTQLPKKRFEENMYAQYGEGIPGIVVDPNNEKVFFDETKFLEQDAGLVDLTLETWELLFGESAAQQLTDEQRLQLLKPFEISPSYAWGLHHVLKQPSPDIPGVKGQMTGLFSWGLKVTNSANLPAIYLNQENSGFDYWQILQKALLLKAEWQRLALRQIHPNVIMHLDEPYLTQIGSSQISVPGVENILAQEFRMPNVGAHCCGSTEYSLLFRDKHLKIAALDLTGTNWNGEWDSANFAQVMVAGAHAYGLPDFLARGGQLALGVLPYSRAISRPQILAHVANILERLEKHDDGSIVIPPNQMIITPVCGAGSEDQDVATLAFSNTIWLAQQMQEAFKIH